MKKVEKNNAIIISNCFILEDQVLSQKHEDGEIKALTSTSFSIRVKANALLCGPINRCGLNGEWFWTVTSHEAVIRGTEIYGGCSIYRDALIHSYRVGINHFCWVIQCFFFSSVFFKLIFIAVYLLSFSCSVVSNSLRPHGLQHVRLYCAWLKCPLSWWWSIFCLGLFWFFSYSSVVPPNSFVYFAMEKIQEGPERWRVKTWVWDSSWSGQSLQKEKWIDEESERCGDLTMKSHH